MPPALQPTAAAAEPFRPRHPVAAEAGAHRVALVAARPTRDAEPLLLAPPPMRLAHAGSERPVPGAVSGLNPGLQNHPQRMAQANAVQAMPAKAMESKAPSAKTSGSKAIAGRTLAAAKVPARSGVALVAEARPKPGPMPMRMASSAGPAPKPGLKPAAQAVRSAAAHPPAAVPAAPKAMATKLAAGSVKPSKPGMVVAGNRSGGRRAQVAEAN